MDVLDRGPQPLKGREVSGFFHPIGLNVVFDFECIFTVRCNTVQSVVLLSHVVSLSVHP